MKLSGNENRISSYTTSLLVSSAAASRTAEVEGDSLIQDEIR